MRVIIPRECPSPRTDHCIGDIGDGLSFPKPRCQFCGRFMQLDEAIGFSEEEAWAEGWDGDIEKVRNYERD